METLLANNRTTMQMNFVQAASKLGPIISQYVNEEENSRRISKPVLDALRGETLTRLFLPKSLGGAETDPVTVASVVEEVARHNTAAAWSLMVANTSAWFCARLPEAGIAEIYKTGQDTFLCGAFHPPMMATPVNGGHSIKGRTPLTSNVHEAQWIFVTAFVMDGGMIKMNSGIPEIIGVFMKAEECEIIDTWYTLGMRATDSNDVSANDVFVPDHRSFPLVPDFQPGRHYQSPLYRFPAIGASIACLISPIALAVARNAIDELKALAERKTPFGSSITMKERGTVQRKLGEAEALVQSSRAYLYQEIAKAWDKTLSREQVTLQEKGDLLLAAAHANQSSVKAIDMMYSAAGSTAIYSRSKLQHYFADAQVIRQHGFVNESRYETVAQVYFGLQPDLPVLAF